MIEKYHISLMQMMEKAGKNLAELTINKFINGYASNTKAVVVLAGSGGNGGGALVCSKHLHNHGVKVVVCVTRDFSNEESIPAYQLQILKKLYIKIIRPADLEQQQNIKLIIDGIIGYSLKGKLKPYIESIINWANRQNCKRLSLDIPSGINATTGNIYSTAIKADATMTLALPKQGLKSFCANDFVGELYLADIGVPRELYQGNPLNIKIGNIFRKSSIIKI